MRGYLLDTSIAIGVRDGVANLPRRVSALEWPTRLSVVTVVELQGSLHRDSAVAAKRAIGLELLLRSIDVLAFDDACAEAYGRIVAASGYSRPRILDRTIAASALVRGLVVVTANAPDFADVPALVLEPWSAA